MTQLLILATDILCIGPFTETDTDIIAPDIIFPKSIIPGWEIVDVTLPDDFTIQGYEWISGALHKKAVPSPADPANAPIITDSYNAALRRKAVKLEAQGQTFEAVQLLLQAQGVPT